MPRTITYTVLESIPAPVKYDIHNCPECNFRARSIQLCIHHDAETDGE
jgi:hypothetical protein